MSKKLEEALKTIKIKCHPNSNPSPLVDDALEVVEQALQELQAIKNANPSEALEWLDKFKGIELSPLPFKSEDGAVKEVDLNEVRFVGSQLNNDFHEFVNTLENYILKAQEQEKVLKIIKEKNLFEPTHHYIVMHSKVYATYSHMFRAYKLDEANKLTAEEFNLLKEWLR